MPLNFNRLEALVFHYVPLDLSKVQESKKETAIKKNLDELRAEALKKHRDNLLTDLKNITEDNNLSNQFRALLRQVNNVALEDFVFGNHTDPLPDNLYRWPSGETILQHFNMLEITYGRYFRQDPQAFENFKKIFSACKLIADFVELNNTPSDDVAALHAYKCLVLFDAQAKNSLAPSTNFFKNHSSKFRKPVHDSLVYNLPNNIEPVKLKQWQSLIKKSGMRAIQLFQQAPVIEKMLAGNAPQTVKEAEEAAAKIQYKRANEYPELARLCIQYNINESVFNLCLSIKPKKKDNLPDITIDGASVNQPGYYLLKLPLNDPRAFILGHITNCCQSIGGNSSQCVVDGITLESNGFYVLLKSTTENKSASTTPAPLLNGKVDYSHYQIVGQGYAWRSFLGNLTFDSWENLTPSSEDAVIVPMLEAFAKEAVKDNSDILRVTIGLGGKTPTAFGPPIPYAEGIGEGYGYPDSARQGLVCINQIKASELQNRIANYGLNFTVFSIKQVEWLEAIFVPPQGNNSLQQKLGTETYNELINDVTKVPHLLELYYYLNQANLLNSQNLEKLKTLTNKSSGQGLEASIPEVLRALYHSSTINQNKLEILLGNNTAFRMVEGLRLLRQSNIPIGEKGIDTIILKSGKYAPEMSETLLTAYQINPNLIPLIPKLIHEQHYNMLKAINDALKILGKSTPQMITKDSFKKIFDKPLRFDHPEISEILDIVNRINPTLINNTIFNQISNSDEQYRWKKSKNKFFTQVRDILKIFEASNPNLINAHFLKLLFSTEGEDLVPMKKIVTSFNEVNPELVTAANMNLLFQHKKHMLAFGYTIISLQKTHPHLLTNENINFLLKKIQSAQALSQIMIALDNDGIPFNATTYKALEKEKSLRDIPRATKGIENRLELFGIFKRPHPQDEEKKSSSPEKKVKL
jgi:hypothetical protein